MESVSVAAASVTCAEPPAATAPVRAGGLLSSLLTPSLCDLFLLAVIGLLFMSGGTGWGRLLWDGDTSLHLAIGNYILDHGTVLRSDPFSYTQPHAPWLAVEWGTAVLFALLNHAFALKGIVFLCGIVIAATVTVLLRTALSQGADMLLSLALALMASNALELHYHARPHLFSLLFLALSVWAVTRHEIERTRWIWAVPLLMVPWANLHPGFAVFFVWLAARLFGRTIDWAVHRSSEAWAAMLDYARLMALCGAASLVNPFGFRLHLEILSYFHASGLTDLVQEFQAPTFRSGPQLYFMLFLFLGLVLCGSLTRQRRYADVFTIIAFAYASLISVRHATVFVVLVMPIIARELSRWWRAWATPQPPTAAARLILEMSQQRRPALMRMSVWPAIALAGLFLYGAPEQWPRGFDPKMFPVGMASRHATELAAGRLFTAEQWADYLLLRNYPRQHVFYDDRSFYGEKMFRNAAMILSGQPGWDKALGAYNVDLVLCPPDSTLSALLAVAPGWALIDRDKTAILFRRSGS